jgi:RNA polymerase sigma-70 factor, ECF subfamily
MDGIDEVTQVSSENDANDQHEPSLLVYRALQGESLAFTEIVECYHRLMMHTAVLLVGDRESAKDVVQEALFLAWKHLGDLRDVGTLRPWLLRIVVNQCLTWKRRRIRTMASAQHALWEQERELVSQAADDHYGRRERDWDLAHAVERLPPQQRVAIVLHYYHGMKIAEMAQALHLSENTLKKRLHVALRTLRYVHWRERDE